MSDYTPVTDKRMSYTMATSGVVTGGDPLVVSGNGTVAKAAAVASIAFIGIAAHDAPSGGRVTVWTRGQIHEAIADGTVTAGDDIGSTNTASRQVKTIPAAAADLGASYVQATVNSAVNAVVQASRGVIGIALTTATDNVKVRWMSY